MDNLQPRRAWPAEDLTVLRAMSRDLAVKGLWSLDRLADAFETSRTDVDLALWRLTGGARADVR